MKTSQNTLQMARPGASSVGHKSVLLDGQGFLFIETRDNNL